ncbi:hypothetical protein E2C01_094585 [Portunus trituberculatus]|uniref:Uncharacterized protein n=1 Tax=Portunus trituberculatus TaxID=210409 RepID=A0A5B7JY14_PORTR|nr:hypothetical protein [Portunus trituberculatus]
MLATLRCSRVAVKGGKKEGKKRPSDGTATPPGKSGGGGDLVPPLRRLPAAGGTSTGSPSGVATDVRRGEKGR